MIKRHLERLERDDDCWRVAFQDCCLEIRHAGGAGNFHMIRRTSLPHQIPARSRWVEVKNTLKEISAAAEVSDTMDDFLLAIEVMPFFP